MITTREAAASNTTLTLTDTLPALTTHTAVPATERSTRKTCEPALPDGPASEHPEPDTDADTPVTVKGSVYTLPATAVADVANPVTLDRGSAG
ncbi:MAG: hypothetical protein OXD37_01160 [Acidimicrobiaceae bacterium]|nr:hypothetical protein [Acidimicrobiaceae bacterium]MCY4280304.1 hypothetical protein [Acidimicrobiaceae bacterium]